MKKPWVILGGIFENNNIEFKLQEIEKTLLNKNFWQDKKKVKKTVKEKKIYEDVLNSYKNSFNEISNLKDLYNLAVEEKNDEILEDCDVKINQLLKTSKEIEINCFLSGENDDFIPASSPLCSLIIW